MLTPGRITQKDQGPQKPDLVLQNRDGRIFNVVANRTAEKPTVRIYDGKNAGQVFGPLGQFTGGEYYAATLAEHRPGAGLCLHGGVPEWSIEPEPMRKLVDLCNQLLLESTVKTVRDLGVLSRSEGDGSAVGNPEQFTEAVCDLARKYNTLPVVVMDAQKAYHGGANSHILPPGASLATAISTFAERARVRFAIARSGVQADNGLSYGWDAESGKVYSIPTKAEEAENSGVKSLEDAFQEAEGIGEVVLAPSTVEVLEIINALRVKNDSAAFQEYAEAMMMRSRETDKSRQWPYGIRSEDIETRRRNSDFAGYYDAYARSALAHGFPPVAWDFSVPEGQEEIQNWYDSGDRVQDLVEVHKAQFSNDEERAQALQDFLEEAGVDSAAEFIAREHPPRPFVPQPSRNLMTPLHDLGRDMLYAIQTGKAPASAVLEATLDSLAKVQGIKREAVMSTWRSEMTQFPDRYAVYQMRGHTSKK